MKFVTEEIATLGCTVAEVRSFGKLAVPPHLTTFATGNTANLNGLGVYAEVVLTSIYMICYATTYLLAKRTHRLASVIKLTTGNEIGHRRTTLFQLSLKQPVLTVYLLSLRCHAQSYDLQIGKAGNGIRTTNISTFCTFLAFKAQNQSMYIIAAMNNKP